MISTLRRRLATAGAATVIAAGVAWALPPPALAGVAADKAAEAEALLAEGKVAEAVAAFDAATEALWAALPLTFRVATFASADSPEPVEPAFRAGETVTIYLEPIGYGFTATNGGHRVSFTPSIEIRTPGGLILGQSGALTKVTWEGRPRSREVHAAVSLALPAALKPGDYELSLTLSDDAGGEEATATLPFAVVE